MSDEIKVGDRVHPDGYGDNVTQRVVAIEGNEAWLVDFMGNHYTHRLSKLTRIEPEKVALTPKYPVGSNVKFYAVDSKEPVCKVIEARLDYLLERPDGSRVCWTEFQLEPVPTPCPLCKGSGKASE